MDTRKVVAALLVTAGLPEFIPDIADELNAAAVKLNAVRAWLTKQDTDTSSSKTSHATHMSPRKQPESLHLFSAFDISNDLN